MSAAEVLRPSADEIRERLKAKIEVVVDTLDWVSVWSGPDMSEAIFYLQAFGYALGRIPDDDLLELAEGLREVLR